jgi:outer membrane protein TolC
MDELPRHDRFRNPIRSVWVSVTLLAMTVLFSGTGCSRRFYRERTDADVARLLTEKNGFSAWKIENFHVYPDPRARFADSTNPDRPPMPPDDPAAHCLAPKPQSPGKAGVARIEGNGYLELLQQWDAENRARLEAEKSDADKPHDSAQIRPVGHDSIAGELRHTAMGEADDPATITKPHAYLITLEQAVELGLINSRDFQSQRETLYLTALPVSLQRFSFAGQFAAIGNIIRETTGSETPQGRGERWRGDGSIGFSQLFPTGALLLVRLANQFTIELIGSKKHTTDFSTMTLDLTQPLLQGGGRAVTLEPLTQTERNLVYQTRNYARFRKEFFVAVAGGGRAGSSDLTAALAAAGITTSGTTGGGRGYLPTLLNVAQLDIERRNVKNLESSYRFFNALKGGGDIPQLNVDQVEQQLQSSRGQVFRIDANLQQAMDAFKIQLGLPTILPIELDMGPVKPVKDALDRYEHIYDLFKAFREIARREGSQREPAQLRAFLKQHALQHPASEGTQFRSSFLARLAVWEKMQDAAIREQLNRLTAEILKLRTARIELETDNKPIPDAMATRLKVLENDVNLGSFEQSLRDFEREPWRRLAPETQPTFRAAAYARVLNDFLLVVDEVALERLQQLRTRWPDLPPIMLDGEDLMKLPSDDAQGRVAQAALTYRLDLMNERAQTVDSWRQIAVQANSLLGVLDIGYHLNSNSPTSVNHPLALGGSRTSHQVTINGELPLVRRLQRNNYRVALINYQRQRRTLQETEDGIVRDVRDELRQLRVFAELYRIQQRQVELAFIQVDQSLEQFRKPPVPGEQGGGAQAAALTNQYLGAQRSLQQAQQLMYSNWINYLTFRLQLYRDLELMPLDPRGVWIDEYATQQREDKPPSRQPAGNDDGKPATHERLPEPARLGTRIDLPSTDDIIWRPRTVAGTPPSR